MTPPLTSPTLHAALRAYCTRQGLIYLPELRCGTGYGPDAERTLDAWACHPHLRNGERRVIGFELKVSRADFARELKQPLKRRPGMRSCREFFFVAPENLLHVEDIPLECGLIEVRANVVNGEPYAAVTVPAPVRDQPPTWRFVAALARRVSREAAQ